MNSLNVEKYSITLYALMLGCTHIRFQYKYLEFNLVLMLVKFCGGWYLYAKKTLHATSAHFPHIPIVYR